LKIYTVFAPFTDVWFGTICAAWLNETEVVKWTVHTAIRACNMS